MKNQNRGILHLTKALSYSITGFKWIVKNESAFRQDLCFCAFCIFVSLLANNWEFKSVIFVIFAAFILLIVEALNSAIESTVDLITEEFNPKAKVAKDLGSLAVFFAIIILSFITICAVVF